MRETGRFFMRNISSVLFVVTVAASMVFAQANAQSTKSAQQSQNSAQTPMTAPHTTRGDRNASQVDRGQQADQNAATSNQPQTADQNGNASTAPAQNKADNQNGTRRATTNGSGVPWGWIIVGIIVIAIILALIGRGSGDRETVLREREIERDRTLGPREVETRRDDDDIRRVG